MDIILIIAVVFYMVYAMYKDWVKLPEVEDKSVKNFIKEFFAGKASDRL